MKNTSLLSLILFVLLTSAKAQVNIDQTWLNANGPSPYYLDQQGETYTLQTDVTTHGSAFVVIDSDIIFDLNGHVISYDSATPIVITNNSFELGTAGVADDWNFTLAPDAQRFNGQYLLNEVYDGNYSMIFPMPCPDQHISNTDTLILEPNTTYSLSAMFEFGGDGDVVNSGVKGYVRLVAGGLSTKEVFWNQTNWRGIQYRDVVFTTGSVQEKYIVQVGIEGAAAVATDTFYIDDINIQLNKVYGVSLSAHSWSPANFPDITQYGIGTNGIVKNGSIVQGADGGTWSHGIFIFMVNNTTIQDLDITVNGANSSPIRTRDNIYNHTISGNTLTSNVQTIGSRDAFDGAVMYAVQGDIYNNQIMNGVHAGIIADNNGPSNIYQNTIKLRSKYTNGFAIIGLGDIHDNDVLCGTGTFGARGIGSGGSNDTTLFTRIFNNNVHVQLQPDNQEYQGPQLGGAYGIQIENGKNIEVYNNDVFAYGNDVHAYAFRMNNDGGTSHSVFVHHNRFHAIAGNLKASVLKLSALDSVELRFEDNELFTNDGFVGSSAGSFNILNRCTITVDSVVADPYPFSVDYFGPATPVVHNFTTFLDPIFTDSLSRTYFENATTRSIPRFGGNVNPRMGFSLAWSDTVKVVDGCKNDSLLGGATVDIYNQYGSLIFSGVTNAQGITDTFLVEFETIGNSSTYFNDYRYDVNFNSEQFLDTSTIISPHLITFTTNPQDVITVSGEDNICQGDGATLAVTGGNTYLWNTGDTSSTISVYPQIDSVFTVEVTYLNGCINTGTHFIQVNSCTGIDDKEIDQAVIIYPVPATDFLHFSFLNQELDEIVVIDLFGRTVEHISVQNKSFVTLDTKTYLPGLYVFVAINNNLVVQTGKFSISNLSSK